MNSDFQNRMFHFQAQPPSQAWDEIAAALDNGSQEFPDRLFHYQQTPPAATWMKISNRLGHAVTNYTSKIFALNGKNILKYTAAAAVILLAVYSIFLMIPDNKQATEVVAAPSQSKSFPSVENSTASTPPGENKPAITVTNPSQEEANAGRKRNLSRHVTARLSTSIQKPQKRITATEGTVILQEKNIVNASRDDRYMIATTNDGSVVRLPKKAYADFACLGVTDIACREKIASMRNKMATASVTTDFAGFLDLLNNLQENQ